MLDHLKGTELKTYEELAEQSRQKAMRERREAERKLSAKKSAAPMDGPSNVGEGRSTNIDDIVH